MITFIEDDIFNVQSDYIVQQCNCLTIKSHGLSKEIAKRFPEADLYSKRRQVNNRNLAVPEDRSTPGSISIDGKIINIFGQWRPGKIGTKYDNYYPESNPPETSETRLMWFKMGLEKISKTLDSNSEKVIAFPFGIGCGLAGGDWEEYSKAILSFAENNNHLKILIVKLK